MSIIDKRPVESITLQFDGHACVHDEATDTRTMITAHEYYGEYALDWVLVMEGGKEIKRYNFKSIESIEWLI